MEQVVIYGLFAISAFIGFWFTQRFQDATTLIMWSVGWPIWVIYVGVKGLLLWAFRPVKQGTEQEFYENTKRISGG